MKIACITKDIFAGGAGKSLYVLLSKLSSSHAIHVFSFNGHNSDPLKEENIEHTKINSGFYPFHFSSGARNPYLLNYAAWLIRCLGLYSTINEVKNYAPDVVILNGFQALWYAPFLSKDMKVVLYAREMLNFNCRDSKWAINVINKYVDCVIAITENEAKQLNNAKLPVHVVYNSYEGEFEEAISSNATDTNLIKIGIFGTIHRIKGQYLVIDLVDKYQDAIKKHRLKFYLYGGASTVTTRDGGREQLEKLVAQKELQEFIEFPGWVNDVASEMKKMDIILRTDTSGSPWGRDIIEAMSVGRPVVAAGSSTVFIKPEENGMLFPEKNIEQMAECIFRIVDNADLRINLAKAAKKFAIENFDPNKNAKRIESILEELAT